MNKFTEYLEMQIEGCKRTKAPYRDKIIYQLVLDEYKKQLTLTDASKRYDANKYTPPFRVGRKQGKAVLDGKGIEVVFFTHSEDQAKMYCDYLNNVC